MDEKTRKILKRYITEDEPFGPIDAGEIKDHSAMAVLFERHNKIYQALHEMHSIVVGRRGSGKTSYLNSARFQKQYNYVVNLDTANVFNQVIMSFSDISSSSIFPENTAKIWENIVYVGFMAEIRNKLPRSRVKSLINDYLAKMKVRDGSTIEDTLWKITDIISEAKSVTKGVSVVTDILRALDNTTFKNVLAQLINELNSAGKTAVILLDSLDDFKLDTADVGIAIQGLLKFIGRSNSAASPIRIRFCLPSELYNIFLDFSSNPNKDFQRQLNLSWISSELVMLAAHRFNLFCTLYPDSYLANNSIDEEALNYHSARKLLGNLLPNKITCRLGVEENTMAYIMRHTQLLPRHLLIIFNSICDRERRNPSGVSGKFSANSIREGIEVVEEKLVQEIISAYKPVFPEAKAVFEACIPELHCKFSIGDLERVFRSHGKKAMKGDDFIDFKRIFIGTGAVGKIISYNNDKARYIQGEFEYTAHHKLVTSTDDLFCFHPLFSKIYSAKRRELKPVYPYGSSLGDRDFRQWD